MIDIDNVSFQYGKTQPYILEKLSFSIKDAETLVILGRNGVGKTTLLRCMTCEQKTYSGRIMIDGIEVREYKVDELSRKVAVVASNNPCYQDLRVADYLITEYAGREHPGSKDDDRLYNQAYTAINELKKGELFNKSVFQLSSGEMQIVRIARAIIQNPRIIIFDEPTSNLDVDNQLMVIEQISTLHEKGYTVIATTHNPGHAIELQGTVLMLYPGGLYLEGTSSKMMTIDNLSQLYGLNVDIRKDLNRNYAVFSRDDNAHSLFF